jgi:uncharacterized protein
MPDLDLSDLPTLGIVAVVAVFAGFVRGFTGFGGPAVMILTLVPFYAPVSLLPKVIVIDYIANFKLLPATARDIDRRTAGPVILGTLVGAPFGFYALNSVDPEIMGRAITLIAGGLTLVMMSGVRFTRIPPVWLHVSAGVVAGLVLGATNIAFVAAIYFLAMPTPASSGRANMVWWGFLATTAVITAHIALGNLNWDSFWRSAMLGIGYLAGTYVGDAAFRRVSEHDFRKYVLWFLLLLAIAGLVV